MAYSYVWPASLPQSPQKGFAETGGVLMLRTSMDRGPAKQRRVGKMSSTMEVNFLMTSAQVTTFKNFVEITILGTSRFGFTHPRTNTIEEVRIVPQGEGALYNIQYTGPGYWTVSFKLEVLP